MKTNIIPSKVKSTGMPPSTLGEVSVDRILHRLIIKWSPWLGTYGMGGPGFFGIQLKKTATLPEEWLILTLWGAMEWLNLDGRWLFCSADQYEIQKPQYWYESVDNKPPILHDNITEKLVGFKIVDAKIGEHISKITLQRKSENHFLEIPMDSKRLPVLGGSREPHEWNSKESLLKAWVITEDNYLLV